MPIVTVDDFISAKFDYLVVGGGTAGLAVAARLTEDPGCVVGVIEAGKYHQDAPQVNVPGMMGWALHNPEYDWGFHTVPQKYCKDREITQSRGKGLGGSSLLNFLCMVRPAKADLDTLEEFGNLGWDWDTMLGYMKKAERLESLRLTPEDAIRYAATPNLEYHGTNGPIAKSFSTHTSELHTALLDSLEASGLPRNPDSGNGRPVGGSLVAMNVDSTTATRSYSASGYFAPNAQRPNFLVLTNAYAAKIDLAAIKGGLHRATGVSFSANGQNFDITAAKEIILAASTFQNPQLLELSGVGDKNILSSLGIETKIDLPGVGENLQDHALVPTLVEVDPKFESAEVLFDPAQMAVQQDLYSLKQQGILASGTSSTIAWMPGSLIGSPEDVQKWALLSSINGSPPEIFGHTNPAVKKGIEKQYDVMRKWINEPEVPISQLLTINGHYPIPGVAIDFSKRYLSIFCVYTHPFARGTVHIKSTSPQDHPAIQQNYLSNEADLDVLVGTLKFMNKVYSGGSLKNLIVKRVVPTGEESDEELREFARKTLGTVHHPVGTCAMLPRDMGGVVDSRLLVYGTTNLRVIDTSIIPLQVSSNTQTMAYAIAEKGADIIKGLI